METLLYLINVLGNGFLAQKLWHKRIHKTHPAFFAFICFAACRTLGIAALRMTGQHMAYGLAWWFTAPLLLALLCWTIGELWRKRDWGLTAGMTIALSVLAMMRYSFVNVGSVESLLCAYTERDVIRWLGFGGCALLATVFTVLRNSQRGCGLVFVCASNAVFMGEAAQYGWVVIACWTTALILWLDWARTYRTRQPHFARVLPFHAMSSRP